MTARGTDWSLALLVGLLALTGVGTAFAGAEPDVWVFVAHGVGGFALAGVLGWKLRRVLGRLRRPSRWDRRTRIGVLSLALVAAALGTGWLWSAGIATQGWVLGYNLLNWHTILGAVLSVFVLAHAAIRAKRPRRADLAGRRQFLRWAGVGAGAGVVWWLQGPVTGALGLRGANRRFTGSYEAASFQGNAFPATSWIGDAPRSLSRERARVEVSGSVARPVTLTISDLEAGDELEATLDCTGGFHSRQRWRGSRLDRVLERAGGTSASASHVRVVSRTGYRYSFALEDARELMLATEVTGEALSHDHGAPVRLVAPGHRGFMWVKWVEAVEVHDGPDPGAFASTLWSSFTAAGRGA